MARMYGSVLVLLCIFFSLLGQRLAAKRAKHECRRVGHSKQPKCWSDRVVSYRRFRP